MFKINHLLTSALLVALLLAAGAFAPDVAAQTMIGVNFQGGEANTVDAGETAGVVPQTGNWNNIPNNTGAAVALINDAGVASGVTMDWAFSTQWNANQGASPMGQGDKDLYAAYLDDGTAALDDASVTLNGITFPYYDIYIYVGSGGNGRTARTRIQDHREVWWRTNSNPINSYVEAVGPIQNAVDDAAFADRDATYIHFRHLSGASVTIQHNRLSNNNGFFGLQIVQSTAPPAPKPSIGLSFTGRQNLMMDPADVAGLNPQPNWNNAVTNDARPASDSLAAGTVVDYTGAIVPNMTIDWAFSGDYFVPNQDLNSAMPPGDRKMMDGYIDSWTVADVYSPINVTDIPYRRYDVIVYVGTDVNGRTAGVRANGSAEKFFRASANPVGGFYEAAGDSVGTAEWGTYLTFNDLSGDLLLEHYRSTQNAGIFGFQIVEAPAPDVIAIITDPAPLSDFTIGSQIPITVNVWTNPAGGVSSITQVDFFVNNRPVGSETVGTPGGPGEMNYTSSWAAPGLGLYNLEAIATDNNGATWSTGQIGITVSNIDLSIYDVTGGGDGIDGTAIASSECAGFPEGPNSAFDNNLSTMWTSDCPAPNGPPPQWVGFDLNAPRSINAYSYAGRNYARDGRDWTLEGSNDGVVWTVLDTVTGNTQGIGHRYFYLAQRTDVYKMFRLNISANNSATGLTDMVNAMEIQFLDIPDGNVELINPATDLQLVGGTSITLQAEVTSFTAAITSVDFFAGVIPIGAGTEIAADIYEIEWTPPAPGNYEIHVVARAADGLVKSEQRTVIIGIPMYVAPTAAGDGSGIDWANAAILETAAQANANWNGIPIMMLEGTHLLAANLTPMNSDSMELYGGFSTSEFLPGDRTGSYWIDHPTIIDGQGSYKMLHSGNNNCRVILDGLTLQNAASTGDGAALLLGGGGFNITLLNCAFNQNSGANGGAVFARTGTGQMVTATNCTFWTNTATVEGGAVNIDSPALFTDCIFEGNTSAGAGGALRGRDGAVTIANCQFRRNQANNGQGGALGLNNVQLQMTDSLLLENNSPLQRAGGIHMGGAATTADIANCEFTSNTGHFESGAFGAENIASATFTDCTFTSNTTVGSAPWAIGGGAWFRGTEPILFEACTFDLNKAGSHGGALGLDQNSYAAVVNCLFTNNVSGLDGDPVWSGGGAIGCYNNSGIVVMNCTFDGNDDTQGPNDGIFLGRRAVDQAANLQCVNSVFVNHAGNAISFEAVDTTFAVTGFARDNLFQNLPTANNVAAAAGFTLGAHLTGDPLFIPGGLGEAYDLQPNSPAVDAGNLHYLLNGANNFWNPPPQDIADRYRGDRTPDLGVYELATQKVAIVPDPVTFGLVIEGESATVRVNIESIGSAPTTVTAASVGGPNFVITADTIGTSGVMIVPGQPATVDIMFTAPVTGFRVDYADLLTVISEADNSPTTAVLNATGAATALPGANASVTINEASGQADPTGSWPVVFDVVFSEGVAGFDATDILWGGDYPGTSVTATVQSTDPAGATYQLLVTGVSGLTSGTLIPTVRQLAARTAAGNGNTTSTVPSDNSVFVNTGLLGVTVITADGPVTAANNVSYTITFSADAVVTPTAPLTPAAVRALLTLGGSATAAVISTVTEVTPGRSFTVDITTGNVDGTLTLALADNDSIVDAATGLLLLNGAGAGAIRGNEVRVDKSPPVLLAVTRDTPTSPVVPSTEEFAVFRLGFDDWVTGLTLADVTASLPGVSVTFVYGVGNNWFAYCEINGSLGILGVTVDTGASIVNATGAPWVGNAPAVNETYLIEEPGTVATRAKHWILY